MMETKMEKEWGSTPRPQSCEGMALDTTTSLQVDNFQVES